MDKIKILIGTNILLIILVITAFGILLFKDNSVNTNYEEKRSIPITREISDNTYKNYRFNFTLEFPKNWIGTVREKTFSQKDESKDMPIGISFGIENESLPLIGIMVFQNKDLWQRDKDVFDADKVIETEDKVFVLIDMSKSTNTTNEEYTKLSKESKKVIESFKFY